MNPTISAKLRMMKRSTLCLAFGLLALLPVIGFIFGLVALWLSGTVRAQEKRFWNPAKPYRVCGAICGTIGTLLWGGIFVFAVGNVVINAWF
jgi:hypothetical protein